MTNAIETKRLKLLVQTREDARAFVEQMKPDDRAHVSAAWLQLLDGSGTVDQWIHGFNVVLRSDGSVVGKCGFTGPPADGIVEIAYGIDPAHQGQGYATEVAEGLVRYALESGKVRLVCAHTLPEPNASTRVLAKAGFQKTGEAMDPEEGRVWRWEKPLR